MNAPIGVLFVGESAPQAQAVDRALRDAGYLPSINRIDPDEVEIGLARDLVEVVIVEYDLAEGPGLISRIAAKAKDVPQIVIGTSPAVEDAAAAMRAGAHDYVVVSNLAYLPIAVERELRERRDRARREATERIQAASTQRLLIETRAQARTFRTLHEVATESQGGNDPARLAGISVEAAKKLIGARAVALYWWDDRRHRLERLALSADSTNSDAATAMGIAELCYREAKTVVLDGFQIAALAPSLAARGYRSAFAVPITSGERVVGALVAGLRGERPADPATIEMLSKFGAQFGPTFEASRLASQRDEQVARLEALQRLAVAASGLLDPAQLGKLVTDQARDLTAASSAALLWLEHDGTLTVLHDNHPQNLEAGIPGDRNVGATGLALSTAAPVIIDDYRKWASATEHGVKLGVGSVLAIPLMVRDEPRGTLVVTSTAMGHFQEEHVNLLSLMAAQVGPSLEGAHQARHREEQARMFEALHEMAVAAGGVLDPVRLSRLAIQHACELLGTEGAVVFVWDAEAGELQPLAETESSSPEPSIRSGEGAVGLAFERCEPVVIDDYQGFGNRIPHSAARGMVSAAAVPLVVGDRPIGTLGVWTYEHRRFLPGDVKMLSLFAAQLAPVLEAGRQATQRERQAQVFGALHELSVAAGGVLESAVLARLAVDKACELLDASSAVLVRYDDETDTLRCLADTDPELAIEFRTVRDSGVSGLAFRTRAPVKIEDYARWENALPRGVEVGIRSLMAVPIVVQDAVVGCLAVRWKQPRTIQPQDNQLLTLVAATVGPAMEAAHIAEERGARARTFAALHDLALAAGGVLDPAALGRLAIDHARDLLGADSSTLVWWEDPPGHFRVLAENHPAIADLPSYASQKAGAIDAAFTRGEPVVIADYPNSELSVAWVRELGVQSVLVVPLLHEGRPVGCLGVRTSKTRHFTASDVQLMTLLAAQVGPTIRAARLHLELRESEQRFRTIFEEAPVLIARNSLSGRLLAINRTGLEMFGHDEKEIYTLSRDDLFADGDVDAGKFAELQAGRLDRYRLERRYRRKDGSVFWGNVTLSLVRDGAGKPDFYYSIVEDVTERRRAEESLQQQADTFRALHDLGVAASGVLEPAALAALASSKALELLGVDSAGVLWLDEGGANLRVLADTRSDIPMGVEIPFAGPGAVRLRKGETLVLDDYPNWEGAAPGAVKRGVKSGLITPLLVREQVIGTLGVQSLTPRTFSARDIEMLSLIAASVGPAIHAAGLHADLVDSEARIRAIFQSAPMTIGRLNPRGVIVEMNPVLEQMTGYAVEEVIGRHFTEVPWAEDGFIDPAARTDLETGRSDRLQYEKELIRKDGSRFWAEITVSTVHRPGGEIDFFYVMVKDINERWVAEQALRDSESRKSAIVDSALDSIVAADSQGRIIEFNPAAERVFGRSRESVLGHDALNLILAADFREALRSNLQNFLTSPGDKNIAAHLESVGVRADGSEFPMEIAASALQQGGEMIFSASIKDLSERELAITATRENEAKTRFLASMSHELRTPLNSILGFAQLLGTNGPGPLTERQARYVGHIESSGRHLLALINDVLDLSKVAAGQMEVELDDIDLLPLVEEAIANVRPLADAKPLSLEVVTSLPLWAHADRRRLLQVMLNLLSNAIKFTPAGGEIKVSLARRGSAITISVSDNGIGIAPDHRERIFEEFTQVQVGALESLEGTGLGLALCRRLLSLMEGTITLESEVGSGSVFTVSVPRATRRRERLVVTAVLATEPSSLLPAVLETP